MSYERRLSSYGVRDENGPTGRNLTPAQLRRVKQKHWNRTAGPVPEKPQPEPVTRAAEPVTPEPPQRITAKDYMMTRMPIKLRWGRKKDRD
jgi:hypothetical protein